MIDATAFRRLFANLFTGLFAVLAAMVALPAHAEPGDIEAAARGVVRVVVVGRDGDEVFPISHGSGFAVDSETIITNAHVVGEAVDDSRLSIGIVPSDGGEAVYGRIVAISPRNDLALVRTTTAMHLPPLTIAGNPPTGAGTVTAVGYPMNVDQAQGLGSDDIFRAQPPVTSQGFLSGRRPSREFDTLLHTAPIARGNSGGPLVDDCGRVVGVNSFGAESQGTEAEFFFAVSVRELLPFLRANNITPRINSLPCRSLDELEAEERARADREQLAAQSAAEAEEEALAQRREELRRGIEFAIMDERANGMALALVMLIACVGAAGVAYDAHRGSDFRLRSIAGGIALASAVIAMIAWLSRPAFAEIDERLEEALREDMAAADTGVIETASAAGKWSCTLDTERSRVLGAPVENLSLDWAEDGCVNERTQYGLSGSDWTRVLVPGNEEAVSVNSFDPASGEYVMERYLLDRETMTSAREARAGFEAPSCGAGETAARQLGNDQQLITGLLPDRPNEKLVYNCQIDPNGDSPTQE